MVDWIMNEGLLRVTSGKRVITMELNGRMDEEKFLDFCIENCKI